MRPTSTVRTGALSEGMFVGGVGLCCECSARLRAATTVETRLLSCVRELIAKPAEDGRVMSARRYDSKTLKVKSWIVARAKDFGVVVVDMESGLIGNSSWC